MDPVGIVTLLALVNSFICFWLTSFFDLSNRLEDKIIKIGAVLSGIFSAICMGFLIYLALSACI